MKLIDKDALVAEIERRWKYDQGFQTEDETKAYQRCCDDILYVIKTLEVKEVDFEREMQAFAKINLEPLVISDSNIGISITMSQLYDCAKHFYSLGLKVQKGE